MAEESVHEVQSGQVQSDPARSDGRINWLSLAAIVAIVLLGVAGLHLSGAGQSDAELTVVVAARDLPAYSRLSTADVVTSTVTVEDAGSVLTDVAHADGRILASPAAEGDPLSSAMLLNVPQVGSDWWILTLPLSATVAPAAGETILLVGVDETGATVQLSDEAVVLGVEDAQLVIAAPAEHGLSAMAYLSGERRLLAIRLLSR